MDHRGSPHSRRKVLFLLIGIFLASNILAIFLMNATGLVRSAPSHAIAQAGLKKTKNHLLGIFDGASAVYNLATAELPAPRSPLPTFELFIPESRLRMLNADLPESGDVYQPARLRVAGEAFIVNVKYRGDNAYHWGGAAKSWAVKFKKDNRLLGVRYLHLINPRSLTGLEMLGGNFLGQSLGTIIAPATLARLFVNGHYQGVVQALERPDEKVLRACNVMPGDLFDIEPSGNWTNAQTWKKIASSNYFAPEDTSAFQRFLDAVNHLNHSRSPELSRRELERSANISKILDVWIVHNMAGSMHQDSSHNQKWYVDPLTGLAEPMLWDAWGHGNYYELKEDLQMPATPPHLAILRYGDLISRKNTRLYQTARQDISSGAQKMFFTSLWKKAEHAFAASPIIDKGYMTVLPFRPLNWPRFQLKKDYQNILKFVEQRDAQILRASRRNTVELNRTGPGRYLLRLKGQVGAEIVSLRLEPGSSPQDLSLKLNLRETVALKNDPQADGVLVPESTVNIHPSFGIHYRPMWHSNFEVVELWSEVPLEFHGKLQSLRLKNLADQSVMEVTPSLPAGQNESRPAQETKAVQDVQECSPPRYSGVCRWTFEESQLEITKMPQRIEYGPGKVVFSQDREFLPEETVVFHPGTTIEIQPDVSLVFRGQVHCRGTRENPVLFQGPVPGSLQPADQWKLIALIGEGTAGSRIEYCEIQGGKGGVLNGVYYTGATNILYAHDILINHSRFSKNVLPSDDTVHIAKSRDITITDSAFVSGQADGLDIDIGHAQVSGTTFLNNGNDGLDIMTSTVTAANNFFQGSGDKGISAGEGSSLTADNNRFEKCLIGIAVKDHSRAQITRNTFKDCPTDIAGYKKSAYYGTGGIIKAGDNIFEKTSTATPPVIHTDEFSCLNNGCLGPQAQAKGLVGQVLMATYHSIDTAPQEQKAVP